MSTFKPLKTLTSRRQVLKAGLAALTLSGMSQAIAKDELLKTSNGHSKPKAKKSGGKRVVVLDPGHGGIDTGAIGRNGSKEKHVVLAIAKNVRSILRNHGIDARLTRSGDTFIPLYDRVEIAHKHGADLFMSIHADGFTNPKAAGASREQGTALLNLFYPDHDNFWLGLIPGIPAVLAFLLSGRRATFPRTWRVLYFLLLLAQVVLLCWQPWLWLNGESVSGIGLALVVADIVALIWLLTNRRLRACFNEVKE